MTESTAPEGASTPPPGEDRPFADIIELFRGIAEGTTSLPRQSQPGAAAGDVPGPRAEVAPEPPPAPVAAAADRSPTLPSIPIVPPAPHRGRRIAVALTALALGAGGLVVASGTLRPSPSPSPTPAPVSPSGPEAPGQQEYAAVLTAVAGATDLPQLAAAAERARDLSRRFAALTGTTAAGEHLVDTQRASLRTLGGLEAITPANAATRFPATARALAGTTRQVVRAGRGLPGSDPATDPTAATRHVVELLAPLAIDDLSGRLTTLLDEAGRATTTAGLRAVAAPAARTRATVVDTAAVLRGQPALHRRATALRRSFAALERLRSVDGDHLDAWARIRPALAAGAATLGLEPAPLARVDAMVSAAQQRLDAWRRLGDQARLPTKAQVTAYATSMRAALDRFAAAIGRLPSVSPAQQYDFAVVEAIREARDAVDAARRAIGAVAAAPASVRAEQKALVGIAGRGREAARLLERVANAVEVCIGARCAFGDMTDWPAYQAARRRAGGLATARARWEDAVRRAVREAPATRTQQPPRPVV